MTTPSASQRLIAAALAVSTTFSIVWSLAALGYPQAPAPAPVLLACR
ncbi:MAG TPA: hypothetical protein VIV54_21175 [Burkholderiales bacterium]